MLAELGHGLLILAVVLSAMLVVCSALSYRGENKYWAGYTRLMAYLAFIAVLVSLLLLAFCFVKDDFSVTYIALHSNSNLPIWYKVAAVWGGHEGSFLFWLLSLMGWTALVANLGKKQPAEFQHWTLVVLGLIAVAIGGYILFVSNPFLRTLPAPLEGRDLNPMLQDIGLILHPPLLYLGYVGFAVSFAMAMATLLCRETQADWVVMMRPWVLSSWAFLTGGIVLGAWWAYNELGWGGWWFWDPVENASLMPWLAATALIHSLMVSKKPSVLSGWSLLLAIFSFSLSILGTFIVRSGVLTSVHAFAADPSRGAVLLLILAIVIISSLSIFAYRASRYIQPLTFSFFTPSMMIFISNGLLSIATFVVLLGTLYPMVFEMIGLGNISVGAPYFNALFVPITLLLCVIMSITAYLQPNATINKKAALYSLLLAVVMGGSAALWAYKPEYQWYEKSYFPIALAVIIAVWVMVSTSWSWFCSPRKWQKLPMVLAHFGVAIAVIAAGYEHYASVETNKKMTVGTKVTLEGHTLQYQQTHLLIRDNYTAEQAEITLTDPNQDVVTHLYPERRHYTVRTMKMTEPAVYSTKFADWYITLGEKLDSQHYAVRVQYKPLVPWLWYAGGLMMIGGFSALFIRRSTKGEA